MKMTHYCRVCGVELTDDNWLSSHQKQGNYICIECHKEKRRLYRAANRDKINERECLWRINNPEKYKEIYTRAHRKAGQLPMSENKECTSYFGVNTVERLLRKYFNDVIVMPMNNPGYDLICNKGKKIDVKSGCIRKTGSDWAFSIKHNITADYFCCVAFDNRQYLNPLHIWMLPGDKFNHLMTASISKSTIHKWAEYEQPIDGVILCCDTMKEHSKAKGLL